MSVKDSARDMSSRSSPSHAAGMTKLGSNGALGKTQSDATKSDATGKLSPVRKGSWVERSMVSLGVLPEDQDTDDDDTGDRALWYPELPWGTPPSAHKNKTRGSNFLLVWDVVTFLSCIYVAVTVPYIAGFVDRKISGDSTCIFNIHGSMMRLVLAIGDGVVDFIFLFDIFLQFHQASWEISTEGRPHWVLIDSLPEVRRKYLNNGFATDFVAQIPWQYLDCVFPEAASALKILRLFRLIKLIRLYRVKKWLQGLYFKYPKCEFLIAGFELLLSMALMAHWLSCIWYHVGYGEGGWVYSESILDPDGVLIPGNEYREWVTSYYWAVTTMTTIGYGDISASTNDERTLAVFVMVVGCAFFAWATGRITQLITDQAGCYVNFKNKMEEVNEYLESRDITDTLQQSIKDYYMMKFPTMRIFNEQEILDDLPMGLRRRLQLELFQDIVEKVPLFATVDRAAKIDICQRLKSTYRTVGIGITFEGAIADAFYIVRFGVVDLYMHGKKVRECRPGDIFGEGALFGLDPSGRRRRSAVARTVVELGMMTKQDFNEVLVQHRSFRNQLSKLVGLHINGLEQDMAENRTVGPTQMFNIEWESIHERVKHSHDIQQLERTASDEKDKRAEDLGLKVLRTHLQIHCQALTNTGTGGLSVGGAGFLALKWHSVLPDGARRTPGERRSLTPVFRWTKDVTGTGIINVRQTLQAHLHTLDNDWTKMGKLTIGFFEIEDFRLVGTDPPREIYLPNFDDSALEPQVDRANGDAKQEKSVLGEVGTLSSKTIHDIRSNFFDQGSFASRKNSLTEQPERARRASAVLWEDTAHAKLIALGEIDLKNCVTNRWKGYAGEILKAWLFFVDTEEIPRSLTPIDRPEKRNKLCLKFVTSATRILSKESRWFRVMDQMRSRTSAQFFAAKRLRTTHNMRAGLQTVIMAAANGSELNMGKKLEDDPQIKTDQVEELQTQMKAMQEQMNKQMEMMQQQQTMIQQLLAHHSPPSQGARRPDEVEVSLLDGKDQPHTPKFTSQDYSSAQGSSRTPQGRAAMVERYNSGSATKFDI